MTTTATPPATPSKLTWYPVEAPDNGGPTDFVIMEGNPITGRRVGNYFDLGAAFYYCRLHNDHESGNYALNELQAMYQSEIHFGLVGFWDGGIDWYLGVSYDESRVDEGTRGNEATVEEATVALTNAARRRYPDSTFTRGRVSDIELVGDQRNVEDLSYELHQAIGPFDLTFDATDPDPYNSRWTLTPADAAKLNLGDGCDALGGSSAGEILREALGLVA